MILTWQQVNGQETNRIVHASVVDHYKEKKEAVDDSANIFGENVDYWPYDCHDLKMTYCLVGKVNWNNKHDSNLLCGCPKRVGVIDNENHECIMMTDEEQRKYYLLAKAHYNALIEKGEDEVLAKENTNKWAAENNGGINGKALYCFSFTILIKPLICKHFEIVHLNFCWWRIEKLFKECSKNGSVG